MQSVTHGRTHAHTHARTDRPKPICLLNFFETGSIKIRVLLIFILIPHIKFQDPISNRSWPYAKCDPGSDARMHARTHGQPKPICQTQLLPRGEGGNSLYFVCYRRAAGIAPFFQVIYTSIGHDLISNIHLKPSIQSPAVLNWTIWPLSLQVILLLSNKNQFLIQYLTVLMIFCMKLSHLNGNKEHFLLSSMMVYAFIGILFPYSSIHL